MNPSCKGDENRADRGVLARTSRGGIRRTWRDTEGRSDAVEQLADLRGRVEALESDGGERGR
ncbi:hypothetical protein OG762_31000 [Streptomyces sp. NBC_01136]|uniref:hypothetical protein n=1 Tax=unclassified Streptomyces TaxID=2593676 RepID=UPI003251049D|nr:hypothetical protein OG762_31000 [Streptomyces sp. NBC_01136]